MLSVMRVPKESYGRTYRARGLFATTPVASNKILAELLRLTNSLITFFSLVAVLALLKVCNLS